MRNKGWTKENTTILIEIITQGKTLGEVVVTDVLTVSASTQTVTLKPCTGMTLKERRTVQGNLTFSLKVLEKDPMVSRRNAKRKASSRHVEAKEYDNQKDNISPTEIVHTISCRIMEATGLASADTFGKADPYCIAYWNGKEEYRTSVISNTLNPIWCVIL